jgi:iron complex transport system substrate-binding protein
MSANPDPCFPGEARGLPLAPMPSRRGGLASSLALVAGVLALRGCAAQPIASEAIASQSEPAPTTPEASATPEPDYPLTVTDDEGTDVVIERPPERIVSLTPGTTEILYAIGAGDRVVATTDADDYPPEAVPLPDVASFGSVDLEAIVALDAGGNEFTPSDAIGRLRDLEFPVLVIYAPTVDAVVADVELIGQAVGRTPEAQALADEMRDEIDALSTAVADLPRPRVFYEIDASVGIFGPAEDSYLAEMISLAGGDPITTGSALSFEIELERLVAADPEIIVLGDAAFGVTPDQVAARPAWDQMTAVREGAVRAVDDKIITRPGPRLPQGLRSLILAIHPDARLP